jgi:hypothetical protein
LLDSGHNPATDFRISQVCRFPQAQGDILIDRHRVKEGVALKRVTHLAKTGFHFILLHPVERLASEKNGALVRLEQPDDVFEQHALSYTAKTDNGRDLSFIYLQVDMVKDGSGTEPLSDFLEFDQWNIHAPPFPNNRLRYNGALPNPVALMAV